MFDNLAHKVGVTIEALFYNRHKIVLFPLSVRETGYARYGKVWQCMAIHGNVWQGLTRYFKVRQSIARYGKVLHGSLFFFFFFYVFVGTNKIK